MEGREGRGVGAGMTRKDLGSGGIKGWRLSGRICCVERTEGCGAAGVDQTRRYHSKQNGESFGWASKLGLW